SAARPAARAEAGERRNKLCDVGSNAIPSGSPPGIRPDAPSPTAKRKSTPASEPSTTPPIRPSSALVAVTARRPNAISTPTGSTKTDSKSDSEKESEVIVMSINKAIVVGNLGRDPEVRALPSGQSVANFSVATKARFKDRNGEQQERTEWHRIVAFG